jgi:hypothetical protein
MGAFVEQDYALRIWVGTAKDSKTDTIGVKIYRKRLPKRESFEVVRNSLLKQIEQVCISSPYTYHVALKSGGWLENY